jgi:hypothetical protein
VSEGVNIKETAENTWFKLSFRVLMVLLCGMIANWEYQSRSDAHDVKQSIAELNHSIDDFKEKQFNPLANAVAVLQTTIDKGINQALDSQNRRIEVLEHRVDSLSDRVNLLSATPAGGAKR